MGMIRVPHDMHDLHFFYDVYWSPCIYTRILTSNEQLLEALFVRFNKRNDLIITFHTFYQCYFMEIVSNCYSQICILRPLDEAI